MKIPQALRREGLPLAAAMQRLGAGTSITRSDVDGLIQQLPDSLANAPAFLCSVDNTWRYEYGPHYTDTVGAPLAIGTDQNPEVRILLHGLLKVARYASCADLQAYISRLANKQKHFDYLAELDPILRAKELAHLDYEPRPLGDRSRGPDWAMRFSDGTAALVEVKSRIKELRDLLLSLRSGKDPSPHATRMPLLPGFLDGVCAKFPVCKSASSPLQGVWVYSPVSFIEEEMQALFDGLDVDKVHFLVVGHGWREYEALTRNPAVRLRLTQRYSLPGI
jgi:hypothetical protein